MLRGVTPYKHRYVYKYIVDNYAYLYQVKNIQMPIEC